MSDNQCCETPLLDLLRNVPKDARGEYEHKPGMSYSFIPYGNYCQRATDEIERLRGLVKETDAEREAWMEQRNKELLRADAAEKRIEELKELESYEILKNIGPDEWYIITDEQIAAAWEYANKHSDQYVRDKVEAALNKLNIFRCEGCYSCMETDSTEARNRPDCNGKGWVKHD